MPERYDIVLEIRYEYESPADAARILLRMLPRSDSMQSLHFGLLECDPMPDFRQDALDFFGNAMTSIAYETPFSALTFRFGGRVQREDPLTGPDVSAVLRDLPSLVGKQASLDARMPHHFLGASERVRPSHVFASYATGLTDPGGTALAATMAISTALHDEFDFDPTATDVTTDPEVAFRNRAGVCQDISHVMIATLRSIGIPAGYVSGFLRTVPPEGGTRLEGADAMHAWVRAWCGPETGWIEIDPTNGILAGRDHVTVAYGRDYSDVAPVRGSMRSAGAHKTAHSVDVIAVAEA